MHPEDEHVEVVEETPVHTEAVEEIPADFSAATEKQPAQEVAEDLYSSFSVGDIKQ